jgi:hypothetical protein
MGLWGKIRQAFGTSQSDGNSNSPRELFAAEVEAMVRAMPSVTDVRPAPDAYGILVTRGAHEQTLFLDNVFEETRDLDPDQRRERIARLVRSLDTPDASAMSWKEVRPKLAPLLRTPTMFASLPAAVAADKAPLRRAFAPFLIECVGVDSDDGITYATSHQIAKWDVTPADVFAAATENACAYFVDDVETYDPAAPYPIWHVARDDSYESSRLLVPGWLASFADKVHGRPVAMVPHRSSLIVGGDGDERCLRRLVVSAKKEFEASPRRISPALYSVDEAGAVVPLVLRRDHPLAADVASGHVMAAMAEYDSQQRVLQPRLGETAYVASYKGLNDQGDVFSFAIWGKDIVTLLPCTDRVMLGLAPNEKNGETLWVPWHALLGVAGDCLIPEPDVDLPRWRTARWPNAAQIARLRAVSVPPPGNRT